MDILKLYIYKGGTAKMHFSEIRLEKFLGNYQIARHKNETETLEQYFIKPIIHRQINGDQVYVPLDLNRVWNQNS